MPDPLSGTFRGELWTQAREMIRSAPAGQTGLTEEQLATLTAAAARGGITAAESRLLQVVANGANVETLEDAIEAGQYFEGDRETVLGNIGGMLSTDFDPTSVQLETPDAARMRQRISRAEAGTVVGAGYDRQARTNLGGAVHTAQSQAAATTVGPGQPLDLETQRGRMAILDSFSQLAAGTPGSVHCAAGSLVACAVQAGPASLTAMVRGAIGWGSTPAQDERLYALAERMEAGDYNFTMEDMAILQNAVFNQLETTQAALGEPSSSDGIYAGVIQRFLADNPDIAGSFGQSSILGVDNNSDGSMNHFVVLMRFEDGTSGIYDPWPQDTGAAQGPGILPGSHLTMSGSSAESTRRFTAYVRSHEIQVSIPGGQIP